MNYFLIYLITIADNIKVFGTILSVILGVFMFCYILFYHLEYGGIPKYVKRLVASFIFFLSVATLVPSTNKMVLIVAGGQTLNYVEKDENLQKIPYKASEIVAQYLDSKIKELENKKEENGKQ